MRNFLLAVYVKYLFDTHTHTIHCVYRSSLCYNNLYYSINALRKTDHLKKEKSKKHNGVDSVLITSSMQQHKLR